MSRRLIPDAATVGLWRLDEAPVSLNPLTISGCVLWLDGQDASTFNAGSPSEGVTVDNWNDKSGAAHHADVKSNTPNYSAAGLNGYPCLHLDGSEAMLTTYSFPAPPFTLFAVARYGSGAKERVIASGGNTLYGWYSNGLCNYFYEGWVEFAAVTADEKAHVVCCNMRNPAATADFWWDGKLRKLLASGGTGGAAFGQLNLGQYSGGYQRSDCYIGEVLLYNRILDPGETDRILAWLNSKWNVYAADVSANVLPATVIGATKTAVADMPFSYARQFVGASSQYITVPYNSALNTTTLSIELWINFTSLSGTFTVIGRMDGAGNLPFMAQFDGGKLVFQVQSTAGYRTLNWTYGGAITTGAFYYLALTYDGQFSRIFQHGVQAVVQDFGSSSNLVTGYSFPLTIGRADYAGGGQYFSGVLADVRLTNRARAPWEIYNTWRGFIDRDPVDGFGVEL